jgi:outer membrane protein
MRRLAGSLGWLSILVPFAGRADTLADAISLAYNTNPTILEERAALRALDETYAQARAGYRPQLSASVEADYERGLPIENGVISAEGPAAADAATVSLTQTLLDGGQTAAQVRAALDDILAERQKLRQTEASVLQAVIQAYADVRRDVEALAIANQDADDLRRLREDAKAQFDVGEYARADLAQIEGRLAGAQIQVRTAQAQLAASRASYVEVVGQAPGALEPGPPLPGLPGSLEEALAAADRSNPAVAQALFAERAAAARVVLAKAAFRPSLALRATYGVNGDLANQPAAGLPPPGSYAQQITASAVLTQPLFTGGLNASRVRQAAETDSSQLMALEAARRVAARTVAQSWSDLAAASGNVASARDAVAADQIAYDGVVQEARLADRTPLEELIAQQELGSARQTLAVAEHDAYVSAATLLAAMGRLDARALAPGLDAYDPRTSFDRVRKAGAVPWEGLVESVEKLEAPRFDPPPPNP